MNNIHVLPEYDYLYDNKAKTELFELDDLRTLFSEYKSKYKPGIHTVAEFGNWKMDGDSLLYWKLYKDDMPVVHCQKDMLNADDSGELSRESGIPFDMRDAIFEVVKQEFPQYDFLSPNEPWSQQDVMIHDPELFLQMVEAGDWRIEDKVFKLFEKASAPFTDEQLMLGDLGTVRFGNHSFNISIRDHAFTQEGHDPSVKIRISQNVPLAEFGLDTPQGQIEDCSDLKIIKENEMRYQGEVSVNHYQHHEKLAWIEKAENILTDFDTFKKAISEKLFFEDMISTRFVEDYEYLRDSGNGYFQQLDKQLEEYPARLAQKDKLACLDIDILSSYYSRQLDYPWDSRMGVKWDAQAVINHMVKSGFENQQVWMLCKNINDSFISAKMPEKVIDKALYRPERLNELRKGIQEHSLKKDMRR